MLGLIALIASCNQNAEPTTENTTETTTEDSDEGFQYLTETFADKKMIRYRVPGFDKLSLDQKKLVYYLVEAGLSGRDIMYDQNYRHNLAIRDAIDKIVAGYEGDKSSED